MPSEAQRVRVMGNPDPFAFRLSGATDYQRLNAALGAFTGKRIEDNAAVLDWGSGCGRIARYSSRRNPAAFHGCDIDGENVAWSSANLPGKYVVSRMHPPLPFADRAFNLIYGISVFTHLREPLQDAWLAELGRVLRPRGILAVTVHGRAAIDFAWMKPPEYLATTAAVQANGLFVASKNDQLDGAVEQATEYVNVFHDEAYLRRHWSQWFQVVAIIPGYIYTHDLVILRRPD